jgi:hypothetical protein
LPRPSTNNPPLYSVTCDKPLAHKVLLPLAINKLVVTSVENPHNLRKMISTISQAQAKDVVDSLLKVVEAVVVSNLSINNKWVTLQQTHSLGTRRIKGVAVVWPPPSKAQVDKSLNSQTTRPIKLHAAPL